MNEYGSMDKQAFMVKWMGETKIKSSSIIVSSLREAYRKKDEEYTERARLEYAGEKFAEAFSYTKGGHTRILQDPSAIARRYLKYVELRALPHI